MSDRYRASSISKGARPCTNKAPHTATPSPKGKTHNLRVEIPARANKKGPHRQKEKAKQDKFREENKSPDCPLCKASRCTATHIIAECPTSRKIQEDACNPIIVQTLNNQSAKEKPGSPPITLSPTHSKQPTPATPMHDRWETLLSFDHTLCSKASQNNRLPTCARCGHNC